MSRYRHEYKYMINHMEEAILLMRAQGILKKDTHAGADGSYVIRSLYFDNYENESLFDNESGVNLRSKFRIRYYNDEPGFMRLEKKSKVRSLTKKDSCSLSLEEYTRLMNGETLWNQAEMPEEKRKLLLELDLKRLIPKVIVTYERVPFVYEAGNVRITFDRKITSSGDVGHFLEGDYSERPIMESGQSILEVKWDEFMPLHIRHVMQLDSLRWTAFSKYYMCRMYHL